METGSAHSDLELFCELMDLPPPVSRSNYHQHQSSIQCVLEQEMMSSFQAAADNIRAIAQRQEPSIGPETVLDVIISIDGTWVKRDFSSLIGVVVAVLKDTGQVIDAHMMSRICPECTIWKAREHDAAYAQWKEQHQPRCQANYEGSAPSMEAEGVSVIFSRSVARYNLRYTQMVSDGDSKSYSRICREKPYGDVAVQKLDCVGHVAKHMGTRLRKLKKTYGSSKKMSDEKTMGGRGRLTEAMIDKLQTYYRLAILRNLHNKDAMKEILAGLYHSCMNTNLEEQHQFCPVGESSWCQWQQDQVTGESKYSPQNCLPAVFLPVLLPVYEALSADDLLLRCTDGFTQNANEFQQCSVEAMSEIALPWTTKRGFSIGFGCPCIQ